MTMSKSENQTFATSAFKIFLLWEIIFVNKIVEVFLPSLRLLSLSQPRNLLHFLSTKFLIYSFATLDNGSRGWKKGDDKFTCWFFYAPLLDVSASGTTYQWNEISHRFFSSPSSFVVVKGHSEPQFSSTMMYKDCQQEWNEITKLDNCDAIKWKLNKEWWN